MSNFMYLTRSRLRKKLLVYFFTHRDANLFLREIAGFLKEDPGNLSKELNRLVQAGVFISQVRGNQKYFSLNLKYPLYREFNSMIFKTIGVEGSLKKIVNESEGVKLSFIYGSFANKNENSASDIDLFIVGNPDENSIMEEIEVLEKKLQREINYNIYSEREFREKIKRKDSFIINLLKGKKIILKGRLNGIC